MATGVSKLKRQRRLLRINVQRTINGLEAEEIEEDTLRAKLVNLRDLGSQIEELNNQVVDKLLDEEDDVVLENEVKTALEFKEMMMTAKFAAEHRIEDAKSANSVNSHLTLKLPRINLEKFDLSASNWLSWWAQYRHIDEAEDLDETVKFQYLRMTLVGTAKTLVDSYPNVAGNYAKVLCHLKDRYGREELIVNCLYKELLALVREKPPLTILCDKIQSRVRDLETIGITKERTAILVPLLEECLPIENRRRWERHVLTLEGNREKIDALLEFLRIEAECEERVLDTLTVDTNGDNKQTTAALVNTQEGDKKNRKDRGAKSTDRNTRQPYESKCLFCKETHRSQDCKKEMPVEKRRELVKEGGCCFACLKAGHSISRCRRRIDCKICKGRHFDLLCLKKIDTKENATASMFSGPTSAGTVVLKTLLAYACFEDKKVIVRLLLDSASHRSYVSRKFCEYLGLKGDRREHLRHMLFGGQISERKSHEVHRLELRSLMNNNSISLEVLQQDKICGPIPPLRCKETIKRAESKGIQLINDESDRPIDVLIGADHMGRLLTGTMKCVDTKLVALETLLGWCLLGSVEVEEISPCMFDAVSSLVCLPNLWELESLGIEAPQSISTKRELEDNCVLHFKENLSFEQGSYSVALPWIKEHPELPTNRELALRRLNLLIPRLKKSGLYNDYDLVLKQWLKMGYIEEVCHDNEEQGHYLPHRPVVRLDKSTKVRPVFDASAKAVGYVSVNECLSPGPNLIAEIPTLLLRFRKEPFGLTADIKQAFLMIRLKLESDKDMLKFLWFRDKQLLVYRHCRVVFGLTSSPFLLNAVIKHHLSLQENPLTPELSESFYVDDCVLSTTDPERGKLLKEVACRLLGEAGFELRGWVMSGDKLDKHSVLGLCWRPQEDFVCCSKPKIEIPIEWTKRQLLSTVSKFFDPIGILAAPLLTLKLLLQDCFKLKLNWNDSLPRPLENRVNEWLSEINLIESIMVPRILKDLSPDSMQLHVFSDACKRGLGVCIFLRASYGNRVEISFVSAKARVTPLEPLTIPRLELIAASLAARLGTQSNKILNIDDVIYWSDSMIALYWIKKGEWKTFVGNRVREIRQLTPVDQWRFVEGTRNPADLVSRGTTLKEFSQLNWLIGPSWLKETEELWPHVPIEPSEDALKEQKVSSLLNASLAIELEKETFSYFASFRRNVRLMAWLLRFVDKLRKRRKDCGELNAQEIITAEEKLIRWIQERWPPPIQDLKVWTDEQGCLRVCTKILSEQFLPSFRSPLILTACPLVEALIVEKHRELHHAGAGWILNDLREKLWIVKGRRLARKIVKSCVACKRHRGKPLTAPPIGLPDNRVNLGRVFQVTGCDLMGPLFLRGGTKVWIVLFTCAVYRAVHLEVVESLSSEEFVMALRRMIARRGRIDVMYSDHGTNFVGTWNKLKSPTITTMKIKWIFNAPTASWWGGFYERLVGVIKTSLKTSLGRALLTLTELQTIVVEIEATVNKRPISYVSEDSEEPAPITPSMFLQQEEISVSVPELEKIDENSVNARVRYIEFVRKSQKDRFSKEYLGALFLRYNKFKKEPSFGVGSVVLISSDNVKRTDWVLGRVLELIPGRDGFPRVAKLKTAKGELTRPVQRLVLLEGYNDNTTAETPHPPSDIIVEKEADSSAKTTGTTDSSESLRYNSRGRLIKKPARFIE